MIFFVLQWAVFAVALTANVFLDRHPQRRTRPRILELALLWVVVGMSVWGLIGVAGHIGPDSNQLAAQIGYTPSMFQWEVGFGDLALCVLGIIAYWWRDRWLTAAVVALAVSYWGDAIGHIMQYVGDNNTAPSNVWAIPSDILQPLAAIILLIAYRRGLGKLPTGYPHGLAAPTTEETQQTQNP